MKKRLVKIAVVLLCLAAAFELLGGSLAQLQWQDNYSIHGTTVALPNLGAMNLRLQVSRVTGDPDLEEEIKEAIDGSGIGSVTKPSVSATADIEIEVKSFDGGGWNPVSKSGSISYLAKFTIRPDTAGAETVWSGQITGDSTVKGIGWLSMKGMERHLVWRLKKTVHRKLLDSIQQEIAKTNQEGK